MALTRAALRRSTLGIVVLAAAACGKSKPATVDSASAAAASGNAASTSTGARKPMCQRTGHWDACLVKARLEESGMVPLAGEPLADLPSLGVTPVTYHIGKAAIALYVYPDTVARERAARSLDPARFIAPAAALTMKGEATAIQNDNLLALLFSLNDQQRERVSDAFQAGPPQP